MTPTIKDILHNYKEGNICLDVAEGMVQQVMNEKEQEAYEVGNIEGYEEAKHELDRVN